LRREVQHRKVTTILVDLILSYECNISMSAMIWCIVGILLLVKP